MMNELKYYLIDPHGTPVFDQAYPADFLCSCLITLLNRGVDTRAYRLLGAFPYQFKHADANMTMSRKDLPGSLRTSQGCSMIRLPG